MRIETVATTDEFARCAGDSVCAVAGAPRGAVIGLASGRTPLALYEELARRAVEGSADFSGVTVFALDELCGVPRDHPATNASYFARQATARLPLRAFHVLDSETADSEAECDRFRRRIEQAGGLDLVVLGIGRNGHLAFNEPGSPLDSRARRVALAETTRETYAPLFGSSEATPAFGLTLGLADLLEAHAVLLLARGAHKADIIARALEGPVTEALPASVLQRHENLTVLLDREAAAALRATA